MQHPFEGVILPETYSTVRASEAAPGSRRRFFAQCLAAAVGAVALLRPRSAHSQQPGGQRALPEAGRQAAPGFQDRSGQNTVTTQALGEEGGGRVTTYALGEEGAGYPGGWRPLPPGGRYTTQALGEEGGRQSYPRYRPPPQRYYPPQHYYPPRKHYNPQPLHEEGRRWEQ